MAQLIYNTPLKVICIFAKTSIKLVENGIYLATCISTSKTTGDKHVYLKNIGYYPISYFSLISGDSLESEPDFKVKQTEDLICCDRGTGRILKDYTGEFVRCRNSSSKFLKENEIYLVEAQKIDQILDWNKRLFYEAKLKVRGARHYINSLNFEELSIIEQRRLKLKNLNGIKVETTENTRKFLLYSEKDKNSILFDMLSRTIISIKDVEIIEKINLTNLLLQKGKKYNITSEDIKPFLTKMKDLLTPYQIYF